MYENDALSFSYFAVLQLYQNIVINCFKQTRENLHIYDIFYRPVCCKKFGKTYKL